MYCAGQMLRACSGVGCPDDTTVVYFCSDIAVLQMYRIVLVYFRCTCLWCSILLLIKGLSLLTERTSRRTVC